MQLTISLMYIRNGSNRRIVSSDTLMFNAMEVCEHMHGIKFQQTNVHIVSADKCSHVFSADKLFTCFFQQTTVHMVSADNCSHGFSRQMFTWFQQTNAHIWFQQTTVHMFFQQTTLHMVSADNCSYGFSRQLFTWIQQTSVLDRIGVADDGTSLLPTVGSCVRYR